MNDDPTIAGSDGIDPGQVQLDGAVSRPALALRQLGRPQHLPVPQKLPAGRRRNLPIRPTGRAARSPRSGRHHPSTIDYHNTIPLKMIIST